MESELMKFAALDSCAVSDALDRIGIAGVAHGLFSLSTGRRIVGRSITVQLGDYDGEPASRHLCTAAVEEAGPGSVVVVAHGGRADVAGWGGLLSMAAKQNGVEGVVVDGAVRDIDESRDLDLPIYAIGAVPVTARGRVVERAWNVPITIAGICVQPGDYVIADGSGVVFVPEARADEVLAVATTILAREQRMADEIRAGRKISDVMGNTYETMLHEGMRK